MPSLFFLLFFNHILPIRDTSVRRLKSFFNRSSVISDLYFSKYETAAIMKTIDAYELRESLIGVDAGDVEGDFVKHIRYLNYTNEVMKIRDRSGFIIHLNPAYSANYTGKDGLVIRIEMHFNHTTARMNYERIINKPQESRDLVEIEFMRKYAQIVHQLNRRMTFVCYVLVDKSELIKNDGQNFIAVTDTAAFIGCGINDMDNVYCPGSEEEYLIRHQNNILKSEESSFYDSDSLLYSVRVVDNKSDNLPTYWANVFNSAVSIKAIRDSDLKDGIYITRRVSNQNNTERSLDMEYYPIEERFKIVVPLYSTKEEATANFSHPEKIYTAEQAREQASRAAKAEKEEELAQEKIRSERRKREYDEERFKQEEASQKRKNTFDLFKYGPVIINALIVLVTLIASLVTKTPIRPVKI